VLLAIVSAFKLPESTTIAASFAVPFAMTVFRELCFNSTHISVCTKDLHFDDQSECRYGEVKATLPQAIVPQVVFVFEL